ncbi:MAG: hypothetical protein OEZ68_02740 [Gammaproteobacteria bacterium]|nr:hypothetical protein [Gammaproteobacteria bacterium]MDH5799698.1 hypothetical protein [Gammaproteobacteria bacterium]
MAQHNFFWSWFQDNLGRIESRHETDRDGIMGEILEQLHRYNDKLFFEISESGPQSELIITAEGDVEQFTSVIELVERAPKLPHWNFIAFKTGIGFGFYTRFGGVHYDPDEMWFLPISHTSDDLGLRIGIPNFEDVNADVSEEAMWMILETALGELECANNIGYVEVGSLPQEPDEMGYIELVDLKEFIEWYNDHR